ncbi:hypothetical protein B0H13DRAFT_1922194 [Mycena leptocephala]|nr:hypothetical protein B0H13DRAFT_1922194 [Mycena leptocephala]
MAQSAPSRHWDTAPPPAMHSDTTQADNRNNIYTGLVLGRRNSLRIRGLWEACGNGSNLETVLESQGKILLWMGLEDGILRLGCGRDAGLRNLFKFGDEGWRSPVNAAFGSWKNPAMVQMARRDSDVALCTLWTDLEKFLKFLKHSTTVRVHKDYGGLTQRYNFGTRCAALYKAIAKIMTNLQCVVMPAKVSAILPKSCDRHNTNQDFPEFPDELERDHTRNEFDEMPSLHSGVDG